MTTAISCSTIGRPASDATPNARAAQLSVNTFFAYMLAFGRIPAGPPGVTVIQGGGVATVQNFEQPPRYIVQLFVQA